MRLIFHIFFIASYYMCSAINYTNDTENIVNKRSTGFLFAIPKILVSGENQTVCLSIHDGKLPAKTVIDLKWREKHFPTIRNLDAEHTCFELVVPNLGIKEPQYVSLKVQVQLNGEIQSAHNLDPILVYPNRVVQTFIHTDRAIYKPGDKVKFRLMVVDDRLLPQNAKIPEIKIKNPLDVAVVVWDHCIPENGLLSLEYELVPEAIMGKWRIEALGEVRTFEVSKYVLPRYKIELIHPKLIYYKAESLDIKVCGQYSHGRPVKGLAFIKVTDSRNNMLPVHKLKEMQNGCADFNISSADLAFVKIRDTFSLYDAKMYVHITATVTEKGTNRIDITTGKSLVYLKAYAMKFVSNAIFQPGLPYRGKIKFTNVQVDMKDEVVEICYNMAIKKSWNFLNDEQCRHIAVGGEESVEFAVLPVRNNVIHINMNARSLNHTEVGDSYLAARLFSRSNSYISLQQIVTGKEDDDDCRGAQQFKVIFTADAFTENDNVTFYYMIKSSTRIYKLRKIHHQVKKTVPNYLNELENIIGDKHKFVKLATNIDSFTLKFRVDKRIHSKYQLLVYYITRRGETVAASKAVDVEPCLMKVNAKWNQHQMVPGAIASLDIQTGSHSLCSVSAVDKATKFLPGNHHSFDVATLIRTIVSEERIPPQSSRKACVPPMKRANQVPANAIMYIVNEDASYGLWDLRRRKRHVYPFSEDYDTYDVFNKFGIVTITNLKIVTKPCYSGPLPQYSNQAQFLLDQYEDSNEEQTVSIRSNFPETWLWELVPVSNSLQLKRHLPHTVTNWVTNVVCVSEEEGVGISNETDISGFQSFFIEVLTPYTVKRDESFYLYIHISNYLNQKFPIRVTLGLSQGLKLVNSRDKLTNSYCLLENNTFTHMYHVQGTILGSVNATVSAEVDSEYPSQCGPEVIVSKRDIVLKKILVEPEGYPVKLTKSALLCATASNVSNNVSWYISTPPDIVPETAKAYVTLNGDLLGRTIEHLEELLDVPTGCGEQIVATMAPNLYVLRYLNASNALKPSVRQRIMRNLKIGYQRILNYIRKDGSFSAFGFHDPAGSMFLTAFVIRTLQEAKQYIYVDQRVIDRAVWWVFEHQLENGCFNTMLHVFQDMGGTSKENSTASLTAYVILSLMEAGIEVPKSIRTNAKYCIRSQHNPDKYTLAISCYALFKVNWQSEADRLLKRLLAVAEQQQNKLWWSNKENSSSASVIEITGYALLSLLNQNTTENLANAQAVVQWLASKFNSNGGFKSTQDTVVALDALTKYSRLIKSRNLNLKINLETNKHSQNTSLRHSDQLKSKRISLTETNGHINVHAFGEGCVLAQVIHSYYLRHIPRSESFKLAVDVAPVSTIDQCSIASLSPCLAYTGPDGPSSMAVMEINLPSGYEADRASLYKLVESESTSIVKMFEEQQNKVNLYLTKVDKQLVCFTFNINENAVVGEREAAVIKLFDYYRPEYEVWQFYNVNSDCQNGSNQLPGLVEKTLNTEIKVDNVTVELPVDEDRKKVEESVTMTLTGTGGNDSNLITNSKEIDSHEALIDNVITNVLKTRNKRDTYINIYHNNEVKTTWNNNLNSDFVNMDEDMQMPEGMEGNVPTYVKPETSFLKNLTTIKWLIH